MLKLLIVEFSFLFGGIPSNQLSELHMLEIKQENDWTKKEDMVLHKVSFKLCDMSQELSYITAP